VRILASKALEVRDRAHSRAALQLEIRTRGDLIALFAPKKVGVIEQVWQIDESPSDALATLKGAIDEPTQPESDAGAMLN
jgi:hypothetical protein